MKIKDLKPGMTIYDCRYAKTMVKGRREASTWPVYVKEVDIEGQKALCSWNGNRAEWMGERRISRYRKQPRPTVKGSLFRRFATREEIKATKVEELRS